MIIECLACGQTRRYDVPQHRATDGKTHFIKCKALSCNNYIWYYNPTGYGLQNAKMIYEIEDSHIEKHELWLGPRNPKKEMKDVIERVDNYYDIMDAQEGQLLINKTKGEKMSWHKSFLVSTLIKILNYLMKDAGGAEAALDYFEDKTRTGYKWLYIMVVIARAVAEKGGYADRDDIDYHDLKSISKRVVNNVFK